MDGEEAAQRHRDLHTGAPVSRAEPQAIGAAEVLAARRLAAAARRGARKQIQVRRIGAVDRAQLLLLAAKLRRLGLGCRMVLYPPVRSDRDVSRSGPDQIRGIEPDVFGRHAQKLCQDRELDVDVLLGGDQLRAAEALGRVGLGGIDPGPQLVVHEHMHGAPEGVQAIDIGLRRLGERLGGGDVQIGVGRGLDHLDAGQLVQMPCGDRRLARRRDMGRPHPAIEDVPIDEHAGAVVPCGLAGRRQDRARDRRQNPLGEEEAGDVVHCGAVDLPKQIHLGRKRRARDVDVLLSGGLLLERGPDRRIVAGGEVEGIRQGERRRRLQIRRCGQARGGRRQPCQAQGQDQAHSRHQCPPPRVDAAGTASHPRHAAPAYR